MSRDMTNRNTITVSFPENTKRIFIFSHTKLKFSLAVSFYRLAEFILEEGLNIICLCNLFNPEIEWEERLAKNYMGFFHDRIPKKVSMHNTHSQSNTILLVVKDPNTKNTLESLATIALLRKNDFTFELKNLENLSYPVRKLLTEGTKHCGMIETFLFFDVITTRRKPPVRSYKLMNVVTCQCNRVEQKKQRSFYLEMSPSSLNLLPYPWNRFEEGDLLRARAVNADLNAKIPGTFRVLTYDFPV
jgi:hypothetical protein